MKKVDELNVAAPWHMNECGPNIEGDEEFNVYDSDGNEVAPVPVSERVARLITAAPDMLLELKKVRETYGHMPSPIWKSVDAVIKKAEGFYDEGL